MCRGSFTRIRTEHPSTWPLEILFTASGYPSVGNSYRSCEDSLRQRRVSLISAVVFFVSGRSSVPDERFVMRSGAFGRYWHRFRRVTKLCNTDCCTYKGLRVCSLHFEHRVCLRGGGLYSSPNIIRVIKSRKLRWTWHVARMRERRGVYRVLVGKP